jgi:hypothetical protein
MEKRMFRKFRALILLALAALVLNVTPAHSTTLTTYNNLASWSTVTTVVDPTITFTGLADDYSAIGLTVPGVDNRVQFVGITSIGTESLAVIDTGLYSWDNFGTGEALQQIENSGVPAYVIKVNFAAPVTAFGTNLFTSNPYAMPFAITLYDASSTQIGTPFSVDTPSGLPTPAFWGVTSDTPIQTAVFTLGPSAAGAVAFLDNFTYGTAQAQAPPPPDVPEAATFLLIGSGLLGLAILGKKTRPAQLV